MRICRLLCRTFLFVMPGFVLCLPARRCGSSSCYLKRSLAFRCLPAHRCGTTSCCLKRSLAVRITSALERRKRRSRLRAGKTRVSQKAVKGGAGSLCGSAFLMPVCVLLNDCSHRCNLHIHRKRCFRNGCSWVLARHDIL